jgi:hypothetical protein
MAPLPIPKMAFSFKVHQTITYDRSQTMIKPRPSSGGGTKQVLRRNRLPATGVSERSDFLHAYESKIDKWKKNVFDLILGLTKGFFVLFGMSEHSGISKKFDQTPMLHPISALTIVIVLSACLGNFRVFFGFFLEQLPNFVDAKPIAIQMSDASEQIFKDIASRTLLWLFGFAVFYFLGGALLKTSFRKDISRWFIYEFSLKVILFQYIEKYEGINGRNPSAFFVIFSILPLIPILLVPLRTAWNFRPSSRYIMLIVRCVGLLCAFPFAILLNSTLGAVIDSINKKFTPAAFQSLNVEVPGFQTKKDYFEFIKGPLVGNGISCVVDQSRSGSIKDLACDLTTINTTAKTFVLYGNAKAEFRVIPWDFGSVEQNMRPPSILKGKAALERKISGHEILSPNSAIKMHVIFEMDQAFCNDLMRLESGRNAKLMIYASADYHEIALGNSANWQSHEDKVFGVWMIKEGFFNPYRCDDDR